MQNFIIFSIFPISILSALYIVPAYIMLVIYFVWNYKINPADHFKANIYQYKLLWLFLLWCALSVIWSESILSGVKFYLKMAIIPIVSTVLISNLDKQENGLNILKYIMFGLLFAQSILIFELVTHGAIIQFLKSLINKNTPFNLYDMDRGCAVYTTFLWLGAYFLLKNKKYFLVSLLLISSAISLSFSDSLASIVAYIVSLIIFTILILTRIRIAKVMQIFSIVAIIAFLLFAYLHDSMCFSENFLKTMPTAQHRLFIWDYVADLSLNKILLGHGLDSSRYLGVGEHVIYNGMKLDLLPLHPHNIWLQIILELGLVGFVISLCLLWKIESKIVEYGKDNYLLASAACASLSSYIVIAMISYGIWQSWWVVNASILFLFYGIIFKKERNL